MSAANETLADVLVEARKRKEMLESAIWSAPIDSPTDHLKAQVEILDEFIDRIEAAWKRDVSRRDAEAQSVGNSAAMRKVLADTAENLRIHLQTPTQTISMNRLEVEAMAKDCDAALAAPPRNCDVGTAEEQSDRLNLYFLGPIDLWLHAKTVLTDGRIAENNKPSWLVVGCESSPKRRPCKIEWVESIVEQCRVVNIPVFVKQLDIGGKCITDINQFPEHLRIRQVPWAEKGVHK